MFTLKPGSCLISSANFLASPFSTAAIFLEGGEEISEFFSSSLLLFLLLLLLLLLFVIFPKIGQPQRQVP